MTKAECQIRYDLAYELASGIHTYHQCKCGRSSTRAGRCIVCLAEDLIELNLIELKGDKE